MRLCIVSSIKRAGFSSPNLMPVLFLELYYYYFGQAVWMWDLSSLTMDQTWAPCRGNVES